MDLFPKPPSILQSISEFDEWARNVTLRKDFNSHLDDYAKYVFQPVYNVKGFGVKGDGVTDDTVAIQEAVNSLQANIGYEGISGGIIFFPPGEYRIKSPINITIPGVTVLGSGAFTTSIRPLPDFTGESVFIFKVGQPFVINPGITIENLRIPMNGVNAHGITIYQAYDNIYLNNIFIKEVGDSYSALRLLDDPDSAISVNQTIIMTNVHGMHKNTTATEPTFFLQKVQEAVLIGCKAWGGPGQIAPAPSFLLEDCRGILLSGCSIVSSNTGIKITTSTRTSRGIFIDSCTFEQLNNIMEATGNATYNINHLYFRNPRFETPINGRVVLDYVIVGEFVIPTYPITINSTCSQIRVFTNDRSKVTDNGVDTSVIAWANAVNRKLALAPQLQVYEKSSLQQLLFEVQKPNVDSYTSAKLVVNIGGSLVVKDVLVGAPDSGGTGYRILRVPN
jgi:hypothetical protein